MDSSRSHNLLQNASHVLALSNLRVYHHSFTTEETEAQEGVVMHLRSPRAGTEPNS